MFQTRSHIHTNKPRAFSITKAASRNITTNPMLYNNTSALKMGFNSQKLVNKKSVEGKGRSNLIWRLWRKGGEAEML